MFTRKSILRLVVLLCALAPAAAREVRAGILTIAGSSAPGYRRAEPGETISQALARLPRTVELVMIVNDARLMIDSPVGDATWGIVTDLDAGDASAKRKSWDQLAEQLGWSKPETLDRLIGSRLMLVVRGLEEDEENRRWAVVSAISEQTDRQLKAGLRPARRNIVDGHPILSIEQGKYEVTSHLNTTGAAKTPSASARTPALNPPPPPADARSVSLLLAEADKTELFDEILSVLARRAADSLAETQVPKEAEQLGHADVFLALRLDSDDPAKHNLPDAWRNFLLIAARRADAGWQCKVLLRDSEYQDQLAAVPETSDAPLNAMLKDTLLAVVETRLRSAKPNPSNPIERLFTMLGLSDEIQRLLAGRHLVAIRSVPDRPIAVPPPQPREPEERLAVTIGVETPDVFALAPLGDTFMHDKIDSLERILAEFHRLPKPEAHPNLNLDGVACGAIRTTQVDVPTGDLIGRFFAVPLRIAWTYSFPHRGNQPLPLPPQPGVNNKQDKTPTGWWLVNIGAPNSLEACARSLRDPDPGGEVRQWYSMGVIRPAGCVPFIRTIPVDLHGLQGAMGRITSVEWKLAVNPNKDVAGTVTIEMARQK